MGYNVKPLELQCAMGRVQLKKLDKFKKNRKRVHDKIYKAFLGHPALKPVQLDAPDSSPCWFAFAFHCEDIDRAYVMDFMEEKDIEVRTVFSGNILRHPAYANQPYIKIGTLKNSDYVMANSMFIGSPPFYTDEGIKYIEDTINQL
jgi:CDP-6-deoxy-D-xylo-4-hexulose-3-dehydrase